VRQDGSDGGLRRCTLVQRMEEPGRGYFVARVPEQATSSACPRDLERAPKK
jgi:hypothetical protein